MKWILWIVVSMIAIVGVIALVGYFLPVSHEASRSAEFNKPPEAVYALISDLKGYSEWWPDNSTKVEVVDSVASVAIHHAGSSARRTSAARGPWRSCRRRRDRA